MTQLSLQLSGRLLDGARAVSIVVVLSLMTSCGGGGGSGGAGGDDGGGAPIVPSELPPEFLSLEPGFGVEKVTDALMPVKLAEAPDGRIFFNELDTGDIRVIDVDGTVLAQPFATVPVVTGGERGLIGLALSPNFAGNGYLYVMACVAGLDQQQVIRFTDVNNVGQNMMVIVDNLPMSTIHNGGDIQFLRDGTMVVSVGDVSDEDRAQTDADVAGRILRYEEDGSIPSNNPLPGDPEWCRGLRNTFDMTVHPQTGGLFGVENGPTVNDELNFLVGGKNYEWPSLPPSVPGSDVGLNLDRWAEVIAPTGITFHDGTDFGPEFADDLFVTGYVESEILWLKMSGSDHTDVDEEVLFALMENSGTANKPLDITQSTDGSLYFSTFTAIWRIYRL